MERVNWDFVVSGLLPSVVVSLALSGVVGFLVFRNRAKGPPGSGRSALPRGSQPSINNKTGAPFQ